MAENHEAYQGTLTRVVKPHQGKPSLEVANGNPLARMPKGFAADHPAGELLRARRWGVGFLGPADATLEPNFSEWLVKVVKASAPIVLALDEAIDAAPAAAAKLLRKPMF